MTASRDRDDERLMRLAISLGRRNNGRAWPNPSVGAVVVEPARGRILGQGVTAPGGRPHAEPLALEAAGAGARGATLYVSLEPCSHHGGTPPCVDAIVAAGVGRVVTALSDPDPRVAGRGHARLRAAGIAVATDVLAVEAARVHRGHTTRVREGRPAVTLKLARTADGFAGAAPGGARLMISGEGAWARTHLLRAHADAVLVGIGTVLADDPRLDVRLPGLEARSPIRVVLDASLRLPLASALVRTARRVPTWVVGREDADRDRVARLAAEGVHVLRAGADASGRLDAGEALRLLAARGITRVLCEGGPTLADRLAALDLLDEVVLVTSRAVEAGTGVRALRPHLDAALRHGFRRWADERVGPDTLTFHERAPCSPAS